MRSILRKTRWYVGYVLLNLIMFQWGAQSLHAQFCWFDGCDVSGCSCFLYCPTESERYDVQYTYSADCWYPPVCYRGYCYKRDWDGESSYCFDCCQDYVVGCTYFH